MPNNDTTGPNGEGPMTGRRQGRCASGSINNRGMGYGRRNGFGFRRFCGRYQGYSKPIELSKEEQQKILESQLREIEFEKQEIEKELKSLSE